ncbi:uncharacterized protein LOC115626122 [Scaptodrosophila lebanonensis]|uniref:Uncharacterized protein LOC115626122 n=1 Tax=Drosophila lebanonensis TaxID=7225 RepID=A0A6J2TKU9_DROLE|nr:uncharacterized protein LOC115626122 [Scaptodrosophila lebanonensis]
MDYGNYGQFSIFGMQNPEAFYPEVGGTAHSYNQNPLSSAMTNPMDSQMPEEAYAMTPNQAQLNMPEGHTPYNSRQQVAPSASSYRCMVRQQKRAREMRARNGLYSPTDGPGSMSGGDGYPCCAGPSVNGSSMNSQPSNMFW